MAVARRRLVVMAVVAAGIGLVGTAAAYLGGWPAARVSETKHAPEVVRVLGDGGDPLVVMIGFTWTKDGYCSGQFTIEATETATEVSVGEVVSREYRGGACAGLGTADGLAWTDLRLATPLGDRAVVRRSDRHRLPVR